MSKIAIHGFGRIGRTALRIALQRNLFVPVSISDIRDAQTFAALFEVDTNYGRWHEPVEGDRRQHHHRRARNPLFQYARSTAGLGARWASIW